MTRILDVDLDFFVDVARHFVDLDDLTRPDDSEFPVWSLENAMSFLEGQCGLDHPLPGWAIERHGEAFDAWRTALRVGQIEAPLSVTHVDAHADLGLGETAHLEIMSELMYMPVAERAARAKQVSDGSYLAYACACGWVGDLTYVHSDEGGEDLFPHYMKDDDPDANALQFRAIDREKLLYHVGRLGEGQVDRIDPPIPFTHVNWRTFQAQEGYDALVICRSPNFTPPAADAIFDLICDRYLVPN